MKVLVEDREYWMRAIPHTLREKTWPDDALVVLTDMNANIFYRNGVPSQEELTGPGIDVHVEPDFGDGRAWTKEEALKHCRKVLGDYVAKSAELPDEFLKTIMLGHLQAGVEGVEVGRLVVAPTGQYTHEILVPNEVLQGLLDRSTVDLTSFCCLEQAGYQCLRTNLLERQPAAFRDWFTAQVSGRMKRPEKQPRNWALLLRDQTISTLVDTLKKHGINQSRNAVWSHSSTKNAEDDASGFDIVAQACVEVGIRGIKKDQTVQGIYYKSKA